MKQQVRGRARRAEARKPGERSTLSMRIASDLWHRLDGVARASGRSLSQEAEFRLEWSFAETAYPPEIIALAELIARAMDETGKTICRSSHLAGNAPVDWFDDAYAFDQAIKTALRILLQSRPPGDRKPHGPFAALENLPVGPRHIPHQIGKLIADGILEAMRGRQSGIARWIVAPSIRERLGSVGARLFGRRPQAPAMMVAERPR